jgi:hypothetical protein
VYVQCTLQLSESNFFSVRVTELEEELQREHGSVGDNVFTITLPPNEAADEVKLVPAVESEESAPREVVQNTRDPDLVIYLTPQFPHPPASQDQTAAAQDMTNTNAREILPRTAVQDTERNCFY